MKTVRGGGGQSLLNCDYCQPPLIKFRAISSTSAPHPASSDQEKMKCRRKSNLIYLFGAAKAKRDAKWEQKSKTIQFSKCQTWAEAALAISLSLYISLSLSLSLSTVAFSISCPPLLACTEWVFRFWRLALTQIALPQSLSFSSPRPLPAVYPPLDTISCP